MAVAAAAEPPGGGEGGRSEREWLYERVMAEAARVTELQGRAEQAELRLTVLQQALADAQRRLGDAAEETRQSPAAAG